MNYRGSMLYVEAHSEFGSLPPTRLLPIIHPASIIRSWAQRAPTIHDLKTRVPMALRGDWRPRPPPILSVMSTFTDTIATLKGWLERASKESFDLAADIETLRHEFISCIGFRR